MNISSQYNMKFSKFVMNKRFITGYTCFKNKIDLTDGDGSHTKTDSWKAEFQKRGFDEKKS